MEIKELHRYKIEPKFKKSVEERETFKSTDGKVVVIIDQLRWGSCFITPQNESEVSYIQDCMQDGEESFIATDFLEMEEDSTFDGCASEIEFVEGWTDETKALFTEQFEQDRSDALDFMELESEAYELIFHNGITANLDEET